MTERAHNSSDPLDHAGLNACLAILELREPAPAYEPTAGTTWQEREAAHQAALGPMLSGDELVARAQAHLAAPADEDGELRDAA